MSGRNDLCRCGSGLKYKKCHESIDNAPISEKVEVAQNHYCSNWVKNSTNYNSQGCYDWMALQLKKFSPNRILDIGCGSGLGLLALSKHLGSQGLNIISIDENLSCLKNAQLNLNAAGIETKLIERFTYSIIHSDCHVIKIQENKLLPFSGFNLIQADILIDNEFLSYLFSLPKFDAVTVWLVGTHMMRPNCQNLLKFKFDSSGKYRLKLQNIAYEVADRILKPGGVLQIVDRGEVPDNELLKKDFLSSHAQQASVTSLKVNCLDYMIYEELTTGRRIKMTPTFGSSGRKADFSRSSMNSIISIKL